MNFFKSLFTNVAGSFLATPQGVFLMIALGLFLAILVPNYNQIKEKLGFDTVSSLRVDKQVLKEEVKDAKQAVKEVVDEAALREKLCGLNTGAVKDIQHKEEEKKPIFEDFKRKIKPATHKVITKTKPHPQSQPTNETAEVEQDNIDVIWVAYDAVNV